MDVEVVAGGMVAGAAGGGMTGGAAGAGRTKVLRSAPRGGANSGWVLRMCRHTW